MFTKAFWLGALDRSAKSFAQALLLLWGVDGVNLLDVHPLPALGIGGGAAVLSLLTSLVSAKVGDKGSSSFLPGAA